MCIMCICICMYICGFVCLHVHHVYTCCPSNSLHSGLYGRPASLEEANRDIVGSMSFQLRTDWKRVDCFV